MRLTSFSVTNYRSITKANKVPIDDITILIGKNNEGKSNILNALILAMNEIMMHSKNRNLIRRKRLSRDRASTDYNWDRDFPIQHQHRKNNLQTILSMKFKLNDQEILEFKEDIKSNVNGEIPIEIRIGRDNSSVIRVVKRGKGSKTLNAKSKKITEFIAARITANYIPAIRSQREAQAEISNIIYKELRVLQKNEDYLDAINIVSEMEKNVLNKLACRIKGPLSDFIPNIKNVEILSEVPHSFGRISNGFDVVIDDGTATSIEYKGDGIKSLATLALLKDRYESEDASIIAIEEPESHLHPEAIHQLNEVINVLQKDNQVILTTHNPLFVNRESIKSNIIVNDGTAYATKKIEEIRNVLGIRASDNLMNANYVLVVEGNEDKIALNSLLKNLSKKLNRAIQSNLLVIDQIGGAGNLSYKLTLLDSYLCKYHVLLDNDDSGKKAFEKAKDDGLLTLKNVTMTLCNGKKEAEFEDCIDPNFYKDILLSEYGVNINDSSFKGNKKWSQRLKNCFNRHGKPYNEEIESDVKTIIAKKIESNPNNALSSYHRNSIDSLVLALEQLL